MPGPTHAVLTTAAMVTCVHQGTVRLRSSQQKLTVDGHPVVLQTDLIGAPIPDCKNTGPGLTPCGSITSIISGASTTLKVNGTPVMTDAAIGLTAASPSLPVLWQVTSAGQTKMRAR